MKYNEPEQCEFFEEGLLKNNHIKLPGKEPGHVYAGNPRGAKAVDGRDRRACGQKRRKGLARWTEELKGACTDDTGMQIAWGGHWQFSLVLRGEGSGQCSTALCCFCCCFFKHEKSQGGVRETTQPRQKQCLGSSSVLILLPQNPVQSKAMDSTDFVVLGDDHDRECLMFSYYWCASVLRVFLSSCIHCFLCFHQWHW